MYITLCIIICCVSVQLFFPWQPAGMDFFTPKCFSSFDDGGTTSVESVQEAR